MANAKIIDLAPIVTQSDTDINEVSLNGFGSRRESRLQSNNYTIDKVFNYQIFTTSPSFSLPLKRAYYFNTGVSENVALPVVNNAAGTTQLFKQFTIHSPNNTTQITKQDGSTVVIILNAGQNATLELVNNSTANGTWVIIALGENYV